MEPMTPEERFTKIENALLTTAELQAHNDEQIRALTTRVDALTTRVDALTANQEKQNAGIRDLIIVSRTVLESQQQIGAQFEQLRDATFRAIDRLTENIDRFIRGRGPNGQA